MTGWKGNKHIYIALGALLLLVPIHVAVLQGTAFAMMPWLLRASGH